MSVKEVETLQNTPGAVKYGAIRIQSLSFVPIMSRYGVLVRSPESYVVIFTEIWC